MADIIPFRPRRPPPAGPDTRTRIEGALALALDAVDHLVAVLDVIDGERGSVDAEPSLGPPEDHESQVVWLRDLSL